MHSPSSLLSWSGVAPLWLVARVGCQGQRQGGFSQHDAFYSLSLRCVCTQRHTVKTWEHTTQRRHRTHRYRCCLRQDAQQTHKQTNPYSRGNQCSELRGYYSCGQCCIVKDTDAILTFNVCSIKFYFTFHIINDDLLIYYCFTLGTLKLDVYMCVLCLMLLFLNTLYWIIC